MARFAGKVGYAIMTETAPGVWKEVIVEKNHKGDVLRVRKQTESGQWLNDDINVNNEFSIIATAYAYQNFQYMRYLVWNGTKWKIRSVEVERPRLIISIGGVYNGS